MKYYFCILFCANAFCMDIPQHQKAFDHVGTPPASPQWHSAPNSPIRIQYTREMLFAIGAGTLARSHSCTITIPAIKRESKPDNWRKASSFLSKSCDSIEAQKPAAIDDKKPAPRRIRIIRKEKNSLHEKK